MYARLDGEEAQGGLCNAAWQRRACGAAERVNRPSRRRARGHNAPAGRHAQRLRELAVQAGIHPGSAVETLARQVEAYKAGGGL